MTLLTHINRREAVTALSAGIVRAGFAINDKPLSCNSHKNVLAPPKLNPDAVKAFRELRNYVATAMGSGGDSILLMDSVVHPTPLSTTTPIRVVRRQNVINCPPPASLIPIPDMIRDRSLAIQVEVMLTHIIRAGMAELYNSEKCPWKVSMGIPLATPENAAREIFPQRIQSCRLTCDVLQLDAHWLAMTLWCLISSLHNALVEGDKSTRAEYPLATLDYYVVSPAWCSAECDRFMFSLSAWLEASSRYIVKDTADAA